MPYDAPSHDLAATHYAIHPDSGFFTVEDRSLKLVPEKKDALIDQFVEYASAKPPAPQQRFRPPSTPTPARRDSAPKPPEKPPEKK